MLKNKKLFLFDIDGTIAVGDQLIDGTSELLAYIDNIGGIAMYISNNSTLSCESYVQKFAAWDLCVPEKYFVTASYATCLYMKIKYKDQKIFVVGTKSFVQELNEFNLSITEVPDDDVSCVLVGYDSELTYQKLSDACLLLSRDNVNFVATSPDLRCPVPFGFVPDCGSICQMITNASGRKPFIVGKPNPLMAELCLKESGFSKDETLIVGDRLYTDIAIGINAGIETALVLTGETSQSDLTNTRYLPDFAFPSIRDLYHEIMEDI